MPLDDRQVQTAEVAAPPREEAQSRQANRRSYSLTNDNYDLVWKEARRRGYSENTTLNLMLEELCEWRAGKRKFVERRKVAR